MIAQSQSSTDHAHTCTDTLIGQTPSGELYWRLCPHCAEPMHYVTRERDYTHEVYGKCLNPDCGHAAWLRDIDAACWAFVERVRAQIEAVAA